MMDTSEQTHLHMARFGVGQPVHRKEDPRLLTGGGRYTDDITLPGQVWGHVLHSPVGHGRLNGIDAAAARSMPGVLAVYTDADLTAAGYGDLPCKVPLKSHDGTPLIKPPRPALARDKVRFVGQPVAFVVAETAVQARDAAEAIELDIDPLPAVTDGAAALAPGAPVLHDEAPGNLSLDWRFGDVEATERAFASAAHVTRLKLVNNRLVVAAMEPRVAIAAYDAARDHYTLNLGCQGVFGLRQTLATDILKVAPEQLTVLAGDVGGSFGMKAQAYPEYVPILHAARTLGRPVKWRDERTDSFVSDNQGRASTVEAGLALDADGNFLAVHIKGIAETGAYLGGMGPMMQCVNIQKNTPSLYKLPLLLVETRAVLTNATPVGPYRGAGRPEGNYYIERLIDAAARETGHDPIELRRRNMIPPAAIPYEAVSGLTYDSGDFPGLLDKALALADWNGFEARRAESAGRGRLRGIGLATYLEVTAPPGKEMGGIRFEADGRVSIVTGTLDYGQGHASTFAQILTEKLGIAFDLIDLVQKDSDQLLVGGGTGGSRSVMCSGAAIVTAADQVIENGRALAAHYLEAAETDVEFDAGTFRIAGTDRTLDLMEIAERLRQAGPLPDGLPTELGAALAMDTPPSAFPNGCHIAEVEIDPETGVTEVVRYTVVDDFGTLINPMLVEGQVHGGIVQGLGQALMENTVYDEDGLLLSGSFMDYAMPRADDVPFFAFGSHPVPATTNPLGVKGCGEAGVSGALPAVMNAIVDALAPHGVTHIDMPATPQRIWKALSGG